MSKGDPITKENMVPKYIVYWTEKHVFESEPIEAKDQDEALDMFMHEDACDRVGAEPYDIVTDEVEIEEMEADED